MKLIYSELKKFLPKLDVQPQQLRDDLTMIGHFANFYEEIPNSSDFFIDLDIKVNRGDCLGYYGLAKDLSVFYKTPLTIPTPTITYPTNLTPPPIEIKSVDVKRILAVKLSNIKVGQSPSWLQNFLTLHQINPINNLVDLTNYAMLLFGIPNHAFDFNKINDQLIWENNTNNKFSEFTTLDGTTLKLEPQNLVITNNQDVLSLSFIGGKNSGITTDTSETVIEMAVYDRTRVRRDSRSLKTLTEASVRLEKDLDTETIPQAFNHLIQLIMENCSGQLSSNLLDFYPNPYLPKPISFDPQKPSAYSGIDIPVDFSLDVLNRLGCGPGFTPPSIRRDIAIEEDLIEEVIRFYGYNKIPTNQPISKKNTPDITPKILYLIESLKDKLVTLGYDEVRSWPLVQQPLNKTSAIYTQNSINSEYPVLRQSIIQSLEVQLDQYNRYKLPEPQFFEIGKIFYQQDGHYFEKHSLGLYHHSMPQLQADLKTLGLPSTANGNYAEIILDDLNLPETYQPQNTSNPAYELTSQIITLDANVTLPSQDDPITLIKKYSQVIGKHLWQLLITDIYHDQKTNNFRYTFRASYFNIDDKTAKKIHLKAFGLD